MNTSRRALSLTTPLKSRDTIRLFGGYIGCAGLATVVDVGLLYALTEVGGIHYFYSAGIAYLAGMVTNYTLNKIFNFKNRSTAIMAQFAVFASIALVGLALNQIVLWTLVELFALWYIFAKLCSVAIVMSWSFYGHRNMTFQYFE